MRSAAHERPLSPPRVSAQGVGECRGVHHVKMEKMFAARTNGSPSHGFNRMQPAAALVKSPMPA